MSDIQPGDAAELLRQCDSPLLRALAELTRDPANMGAADATDLPRPDYALAVCVSLLQGYGETEVAARHASASFPRVGLGKSEAEWSADPRLCARALGALDALAAPALVLGGTLPGRLASLISVDMQVAKAVTSLAAAAAVAFPATPLPQSGGGGGGAEVETSVLFQYVSQITGAEDEAEAASFVPVSFSQQRMLVALLGVIDDASTVSAADNNAGRAERRTWREGLDGFLQGPVGALAAARGGAPLRPTTIAEATEWAMEAARLWGGRAAGSVRGHVTPAATPAPAQPAPRSPFARLRSLLAQHVLEDLVKSLGAGLWAGPYGPQAALDGVPSRSECATPSELIVSLFTSAADALLPDRGDLVGEVVKDADFADVCVLVRTPLLTALSEALAARQLARLGSGTPYGGPHASPAAKAGGLGKRRLQCTVSNKADKAGADGNSLEGTPGVTAMEWSMVASGADPLHMRMRVLAQTDTAVSLQELTQTLFAIDTDTAAPATRLLLKLVTMELEVNNAKLEKTENNDALDVVESIAVIRAAMGRYVMGVPIAVQVPREPHTKTQLAELWRLAMTRNASIFGTELPRFGRSASTRLKTLVQLTGTEFYLAISDCCAVLERLWGAEGLFGGNLGLRLQEIMTSCADCSVPDVHKYVVEPVLEKTWLPWCRRLEAAGEHAPDRQLVPMGTAGRAATQAQVEQQRSALVPLSQRPKQVVYYLDPELMPQRLPAVHLWITEPRTAVLQPVRAAGESVLKKPCLTFAQQRSDEQQQTPTVASEALRKEREARRRTEAEAGRVNVELKRVMLAHEATASELKREKERARRDEGRHRSPDRHRERSRDRSERVSSPVPVEEPADGSAMPKELMGRTATAAKLRAEWSAENVKLLKVKEDRVECPALRLTHVCRARDHTDVNLKCVFVHDSQGAELLDDDAVHAFLRRFVMEHGRLPGQFSAGLKSRYATKLPAWAHADRKTPDRRGGGGGSRGGFRNYFGSNRSDGNRGYGNGYRGGGYSGGGYGGGGYNRSGGSNGRRY